MNRSRNRAVVAIPLQQDMLSQNALECFACVAELVLKWAGVALSCLEHGMFALCLLNVTGRLNKQNRLRHCS